MLFFFSSCYGTNRDWLGVFKISEQCENRQRGNDNYINSLISQNFSCFVLRTPNISRVSSDRQIISPKNNEAKLGKHLARIQKLITKKQIEKILVP